MEQQQGKSRVESGKGRQGGTVHTWGQDSSLASLQMVALHPRITNRLWEHGALGMAGGEVALLCIRWVPPARSEPCPQHSPLSLCVTQGTSATHSPSPGSCIPAHPAHRAHMGCAICFLPLQFPG